MFRQRLLVIVVLSLLVAGSTIASREQAAQPARLKVLISVDMEGVAGVVTSEQLGPTGFEYGRFREFMTREALAAVEGARAAGATEIVVADAHGNGQNLLIEQFPDDVRVIRSWPRKLSMVAGVDEGVDALVFIGYHAGSNNPAGVRAHTFSSATLTRVALNGHFGVPVVMIAGDDAAIAEVRRAVGEIEAAETKRSLGFHSANTLTPQAAAAEIRRRVEAGLRGRQRFSPYRVGGPVTVDVSFKNYMPAEVLTYLPLFERTDSHSIRFSAADMAQASAIMAFITGYSPDITP